MAAYTLLIWLVLCGTALSQSLDPPPHLDKRVERSVSPNDDDPSTRDQNPSLDSQHDKETKKNIVSDNHGKIFVINKHQRNKTWVSLFEDDLNEGSGSNSPDNDDDDDDDDEADEDEDVDDDEYNVPHICDACENLTREATTTVEYRMDTDKSRYLDKTTWWKGIGILAGCVVLICVIVIACYRFRKYRQGRIRNRRYGTDPNKLIQGAADTHV